MIWSGRFNTLQGGTENPIRNPISTTHKINQLEAGHLGYVKQVFLVHSCPMIKKTVAIYARVSTGDQTADNQLIELRQVAERMGWVIVEEYLDQGISGSKDRKQRPAYDQMCSAIVQRKFDVVMAWSVDRLGRSLQQLVALLMDMNAKGIDLYLHQQGLDTTTPTGKAMFQMCGVFAEFEQAMIQERVKAGLERARSQGKTLGRPRTSSTVEQQIKDARQQGKGIRKIASELGIGVSVVQRVVHSSSLKQ